MNASVHSFIHPADYLVSRIIYRDALILIIDKPSGMPVHTGTGEGETLEEYFDALRFGLPKLPALAHRLDRGTSGCLVLGRHRKALQRLGKLFSSGHIKKRYWAIVEGTPDNMEGTIDFALTKKTTAQKQWHMELSKSGQPAITDYRVMGKNDYYSWLELTPRTGRTHQLRVHCAALGHPIIGDRLYGNNMQKAKQLLLHAYEITIPLYPKKSDITVQAPVPEHMQKILLECGWTKSQSCSDN